MPLSLLHRKVLHHLVKNAESTLTPPQVHPMMDIFQLENCILFQNFEHPKHPGLQSTLPHQHLPVLPPISSIMQANSHNPLQACLWHPALCFTADPPNPLIRQQRGHLFLWPLTQIQTRREESQNIFAILSHGQDGKGQSDQFSIKTKQLKSRGYS